MRRRFPFLAAEDTNHLYQLFLDRRRGLSWRRKLHQGGTILMIEGMLFAILGTYGWHFYGPSKMAGWTGLTGLIAALVGLPFALLPGPIIQNPMPVTVLGCAVSPPGRRALVDLWLVGFTPRDIAEAMIIEHATAAPLLARWLPRFLVAFPTILGLLSGWVPSDLLPIDVLVAAGLLLVGEASLLDLACGTAPKSVQARLWQLTGRRFGLAWSSLIGFVGGSLFVVVLVAGVAVSAWLVGPTLSRWYPFRSAELFALGLFLWSGLLLWLWACWCRWRHPRSYARELARAEAGVRLLLLREVGDIPGDWGSGGEARTSGSTCQ